VTVVLFTCTGQRVDMIDAFNEAGAITLATDTSILAPTLHRASSYALVPGFTEPEYIPALAELVREHGVDVIVPLTDFDHRVLSEPASREALAPALVLLPDRDVIENTADKYNAHVFFCEHGIASPDTWLPEDLPDEIDCYPVLVKAREGFSGNHIYRARNRKELDFFLNYTEVSSMVQKQCQGTEFSVDIFCDLDSRCLNAIPRSMIHSKGGESIKGMSVRDPELIELGRRVGETMRLRGPATVQCFREANGRLEITDVNPRFGGAFALPLAAGSHYPELIMALAAGEHPEPHVGEFEEGVLMLRYYSQVVMKMGDDGKLVPLDRPLATESQP
jgi:carbamoyl-phosphate synthase large subunit